MKYGIALSHIHARSAANPAQPAEWTGSKGVGLRQVILPFNTP